MAVALAAATLLQMTLRPLCVSVSPGNVWILRRSVPPASPSSAGGSAELGSELGEYLCERGGSQAELAASLDVRRPPIDVIETGTCDTSVALAFKVARLFKARFEAAFAP